MTKDELTTLVELMEQFAYDYPNVTLTERNVIAAIERRVTYSDPVLRVYKKSREWLQNHIFYIEEEDMDPVMLKGWHKFKRNLWELSEDPAYVNEFLHSESVGGAPLLCVTRTSIRSKCVERLGYYSAQDVPQDEWEKLNDMIIEEYIKRLTKKNIVIIEPD